MQKLPTDISAQPRDASVPVCYQLKENVWVRTKESENIEWTSSNKRLISGHFTRRRFRVHA